MKKKRELHLGAIAVLSLSLLAGCGTSKNLNPLSQIIYQGADPPTINVGVNPPNIHRTYVRVAITINDSNLSMIPADAWTITGYHISYSLLSDPGHHLQSLPPDDHKKIKTQVKPGVPARISVQIVSDSYLQDNAAGFVGTSDTAVVKAHLVFHCVRNKDGMPQDVPAKFVFTIGNF